MDDRRYRRLGEMSPITRSEEPNPTEYPPTVYVTEYLMRRLFAPGLLLLASFCLLVVAAYVERHTKNLELDYIFILFVDIWLSFAALFTYQFSRWLRGLGQAYWNHLTPPFQRAHTFREILDNLLRSVKSRPLHQHQHPDADIGNVAVRASILLIFGMIAIFIGYQIVSVFFTYDTLRQTVTQNVLEGQVSLLTAAVSVIAGKIIGLILIVLFSITNQLLDGLLGAGLVLFPAIFFVPFSKCVLWLSNEACEGIFENIRTRKTALIGWVLLIPVLVMNIWLLWQGLS